MSTEAGTSTSTGDTDNLQRLPSVPVILDGKFFEICKENQLKLTGNSNNNIKAICILCRENKMQTIISGTLKTTTNFKTHLKVSKKTVLSLEISCTL